MRQVIALLALSALAALFGTSSAPGPAAASSAPGTGPTGALGILPDPNYGPGNHVIDLATTGEFDQANWLVVLDYQSFTVGAGAVVSFANHPTRAAVVIRAVEPIVIEGELNLDGEWGNDADEPFVIAEPGPGGFRGGSGSYFTSSGWSAGLGWGGGRVGDGPGESEGGNASHLSVGFEIPVLGDAGATYGAPAGVPLAGGAGGAGGSKESLFAVNAGGGAGGGALLLGSDTRIDIAGTLSARGGRRGQGVSNDGYGGHGSGGVIRLFAPEVTTAPGTLDARGGISSVGTNTYGGDGAIRLEVDGDTQSDGDPNPDIQGGVHTPLASISHTLGEFIPATPPRVELASFWDPDAGPSGEWVSIWQHPLGPRAVIYPGTQADVQLPEPGLVTFKVAATDVPLGAPLEVRVAHTRGQADIFPNHPHGPSAGQPITIGESAGPAGEASTLTSSWTDVTLDLSEGISAIQVRAVLP